MFCIECKKDCSSATHTDKGYICSDCTNMKKYNSGEEGFFLCKICSKADSTTNWISGLEDELCFNCSFWTRGLKEYKKGNKIVVNGSMYHIGTEQRENIHEFRGFGGRRSIIRMLETNKTVISTNLWHNGRIPEHFRSQLPDNAEFLEERRKKMRHNGSVFST